MGGAIASFFSAAMCFCGAVLMIKTRAFFLVHPVRFIRIIAKSGRSDGVGPWKALSVSLAGVLGVGNIAGVCVAMSLGGPGAVFWMWASAFLSMPLKYAEIYLGIKYREKKGGEGSPMLYTEGLRFGRPAARLYAVLCIISALTLGNITQTGAASDALSGAFGIPRAAVGISVAAVSALIIIGRFEKLANLTSAIVPLMSFTYIFLCAAVIIRGAGRLTGAFSSVIEYAFSAKSAAGGVFGWGLASALRHGTVKGCFSHEAGSGTAVFAHTHSGASPERQACFGIIEVFLDTTVICSLTAFAVMASGVDFRSFGYSGTDCVIKAFSASLGSWSGKAASLCIAMFAVATVFCWSSYGLTALRYLFRSPSAGKIYLLFYCSASVCGAFLRSKAVWTLTDISVLSLTALNLAVIMTRRSEIYSPLRR